MALQPLKEERRNRQKNLVKNWLMYVFLLKKFTYSELKHRIRKKLTLKRRKERITAKIKLWMRTMTFLI